MPIHTPIYTFGSIAEANGSVIKSGILWRVLGADGTVIAAGLGNGTAIYPAQTGAVIATPNIGASATTGYEVVSGTATVTLAVAGTGYIPTEVVTMAGGSIDIAGEVVGTRLSIVVDTVGGSGEILTWSLSAGTAGRGDYLVLPDLTAPVATTSSVAGTNATFDVSQDVTGFSLNASNEWVLNPKRTAGTPSAVYVRLPVMNQGTAGWWFARSVGFDIVATALTQLTDDAVDVEKATSLRIREERLGVLDGSDWGDAMVYLDTAANWKGASQRANGATQNVGSSTTDLTGARFKLEAHNTLRDADVAFFLLTTSVQDLDSTSEMAPLIGQDSPIIIAHTTPFTFTAADSEDVDRLFISIVAYAGPTANDEQTWTVESLEGCDMGWAAR